MCNPPSLPRSIRLESCGSIHIDRKSPKALRTSTRESHERPDHVRPLSSDPISESLVMNTRRSSLGSTRTWLNEYPAFELTSSVARFIFCHDSPPSPVR